MFSACFNILVLKPYRIPAAYEMWCICIRVTLIVIAVPDHAIGEWQVASRTIPGMSPALAHASIPLSPLFWGQTCSVLTLALMALSSLLATALQLFCGTKLHVRAVLLTDIDAPIPPKRTAALFAWLPLLTTVKGRLPLTSLYASIGIYT